MDYIAASDTSSETRSFVNLLSEYIIRVNSRRTRTMKIPATSKHQNSITSVNAQAKPIPASIVRRQKGEALSASGGSAFMSSLLALFLRVKINLISMRRNEISAFRMKHPNEMTEYGKGQAALLPSSKAEQPCLCAAA